MKRGRKVNTERYYEGKPCRTCNTTTKYKLQHHCVECIRVRNAERFKAKKQAVEAKRLNKQASFNLLISGDNQKD